MNKILLLLFVSLLPTFVSAAYETGAPNKVLAVPAAGGRPKYTNSLNSIVIRGFSTAFRNQTEGNYTLTDTDDVVSVSASGAAKTITLLGTASTGKIYTIVKNDSSFNRVTISGTIDGSANAILPFQRDALTLIFDGAAWQTLVSKIGAWVDGTTMITPENYGSLGVGTHKTMMRKSGDSLEVRGTFKAGSVAASAPYFAISSTVGTIDTAKFSSTANVHMVGKITVLESASTTVFTNNGTGDIFFDVSNTDRVFPSGASASYTYTKAAANTNINNNVQVTYFFTVPMTGWK